jgi:hypothetical protein
VDYVRILVKNIHIDMCHVGVKKLTKYMSSLFFWPNMQESIQNSLRSCEICSKRKILQEKTKQILLPRTSNEFLEQIVVDIAYMSNVGPYKYMLVIIDRFSKVISLSALEKQDEKSIFKAILNNWIYRFGKPQSCLSDRGKNFDSSFMRNQLGKLGISQEFSSPYQHQSNGLVERTIRTVRDLIAASVLGGSEERNWVDILPKIEFCINATQQSATGYSPFEIIYGRKINLHSTLPQTLVNRDDVVRAVQENSKKAVEQMQKMDENKRGKRIFVVGEKVLVRKEPQNRNKDGLQYEGPYTISKFISEHQVELTDGNAKKLRRLEWLKRWVEF